MTRASQNKSIRIFEIVSGSGGGKPEGLTCKVGGKQISLALASANLDQHPRKEPSNVIVWAGKCFRETHCTAKKSVSSCLLLK